MNKRRFGRISLLVSASLAVLVAVQVWSLVNMYHARREEFSRQVMQAMTRAAYDDLLLGNKPSGQKSHITFSSSGNIDSIQVDMIQEITVKNLSGAGKSITFTPKSDTIHHDISVSNGGTTRLIRQEIRIPSVYVLRLNMARYDSLLTCNLAAAGIDLPHKVDVVRGPTDSTSSARLFTTKPLTEPEVVLTPLNDSLRLRDPLTFTTSLTTDKEFYFRLRIENPDRQLLGEMAGVAVSSLLMLVAVAGALLYLLRTLFRQKTLEEMRRDLTHNITHELKTPIAVANAANDALLDFGAADDVQRRRRYLTVIRQQLASLSDMVQRILTMSVEERGEFGFVREETDVGALLREVADEYRLKARKEARIELRVEPDPLLFPPRPLPHAPSGGQPGGQCAQVFGRAGAHPHRGAPGAGLAAADGRRRRHRHRPSRARAHLREVLPCADRRPAGGPRLRPGTLLRPPGGPAPWRHHPRRLRPGTRHPFHHPHPEP